jgi:hypothetical protein
MLVALISPVALPLTGATALCDLVARRRRNAPRPGKTLKKLQTDNSIYDPYHCELKLPVASKSPVALPLTGATALCNLELCCE